MEERVNIAELLRGCPKGMELYSPVFGKVYLDKIRPHLAIVVTTDKEQGDFKEEFLYDGRYGMNGECMLFPSKGKTNWEGFVPPHEFKNGDIIFTRTFDATWVSIFKQFSEDRCCTYIDLCIDDNNIYNTWGVCHIEEITEQRLATEKEKLKLFDAISAYNYESNEETKTLEKLPKFKIGDWVVNIDEKVNQVVAIDDDGFTLDDGSHCNNAWNKLYRLWTIQDAKEGDVLTDHCDDYKNPLIFILKKFEKVNFGLVLKSDYSSYCFLTMSDKPRFKEGHFHHKHDIKPATKEQRDVLFQKMKESGYEWDAEKKELRKIEQKPAWSEEDEMMLEGAIHKISDLGTGEMVKDWLKSLKDRLTWKPSDKQMEQLGWVAEQNKNNMIGKELMTLYNDLKKLKE